MTDDLWSLWRGTLQWIRVRPLPWGQAGGLCTLIWRHRRTVHQMRGVGRLLDPEPGVSLPSGPVRPGDT